MANPNKSLTRQIRSFPKGIDSYVDPLLLPRTQLAFATNATFRGNFATQRPSLLRYTLQDTNSGTDLAAFQTALFQGAAYYRSGNNGYIMVAVNGNLFQITPNLTTGIATVVQIAKPTVTISASYTSAGNYSTSLLVGIPYVVSKGAHDTSWSLDGVTFSTAWPAVIAASKTTQTLYLKGTDSTTVTVGIVQQSSMSQFATQNWMWQSEVYLIWNDGSNLPIFWNGSYSRRSLGANLIQLGVTNANFNAPAQSQYLSPALALVAPFAGSVPSVVLISGAQYEVTGSSSAISGTTATLFLDQVSGSGGASDYIQPGVGVYQSSAYAGVILSTDQSPAVYPPEPTGGQSGSQAVVNVLSSFSTGSVPLGTTVYDSAKYCGVITAAAASGSAISVFPVPTTTNITVVVEANMTGASGTLTCYSGILKQVACSGPIVSVGTYSGGHTPVTFSVTSCPFAGQAVVVSGTSGTTAEASNGFAAYGVFSVSVSTWPAVGNTPFTLTFSKQFGGAVGDTLSIPVTGQTFQNVAPVVTAISGTQVTMTMPSSFSTANVAIPINNTTLITNTTQANAAATNYGVTFSTSPAVGSTITLILTPATGTTLVEGQTLYFSAAIAGGGFQNIVGVILSAPSNGTYGNAANIFTLTLSQPFQGKVGNTLQTGASGSLATFTVYAIVSASAGVIQCQMTNVPSSATIPIVTPSAATTLDLVINNTQKNQTGGPTLTLVGTYPSTLSAITTGSLSAVVGLFTQSSGTPATTNSVVQIAVTSNQSGTTPTATSPDIFIVASTTNGGTAGSNTINIYNLNDTEGRQIPPGTPIYSLPELPQSRMGCYGLGRNWVAVTDGTSCNSFVAGDTVGSSSGTPPSYQDSVLKVSQNYFLAGGLTFQISGAGEEIVAMAFLAQLNVALGQGPLNIFTDDSVINCQAPPDATTWATLTNPIITSGLIGSGGISQDAVIQENADLIFRLSTGGVQSIQTATIGFSQWGNTPISNEIIRIIESDPANLLPFTSIVVFNNRLLMSCQLSQQARGVTGGAIAVLNFDSISTLQGKGPSIWEGQWTGLNVLQFVTGFFGGAEQCFALCLNGNQIELSQILLDNAANVDNGNSPIVWSFETGMVFDPQSQTPESRSYKRLISGEYSVDEITSNLTVQVFYKPDQFPNWIPWYTDRITYQGVSDPGFRSRRGLGEPNPQAYDSVNNRPLREAYDFQVQFVITGACRFVVGRFEAVEIPEPQFATPKNT